MITLFLGLATTYFGSAGTANRSVMYRVEDDVAGGIMSEDLLSTIGMRGSLPLLLPMLTTKQGHDKFEKSLSIEGLNLVLQFLIDATHK